MQVLEVGRHVSQGCQAISVQVLVLEHHMPCETMVPNAMHMYATGTQDKPRLTPPAYAIDRIVCTTSY